MTSRLDPVDAAAPAEMRALAERLRSAMKGADYTALRALATDASLSASTVSDALKGAKVPSWDVVTNLLKTCAIPPDRTWRTLWESARAAADQWRGGTPQPAPPEPRKPGSLSIRPPIGSLPTRVRGRDAVLDHLVGLLAEPKPTLQVLHGLGGCGKTTIALELARRARETGCAVFWVSASQRAGFIEAMKAVAKEIDIPDEHVERAWTGVGSAMDLLWRYLDAAERPWLLVVDNADEPDVLAAASGLPGDGTGWVRPSPAGTTVLTSRIGTPEVWGSQAERHQVQVLDEEDAADVLIDLAGHAGDRSAARALAERLGGLPLALSNAGSYLGRTARGGGLLRRSTSQPTRIASFEAFRDSLGDLGTDLLDEGLVQPNETERLERHHRRLVGRTWEMSLDLLEAQGITHARALMRLMSCFAPVPLPVDLINEEVIGETSEKPVLLDDVNRALEALVDLTMLSVTQSGVLAGVPEHVSEPPLFCLVGHRLVLETTASRLRDLPTAEQAPTWRAATRLISGAATPAPETAANWDWWRLLLPHVAALVAVIPEQEEDVFIEVLRCGVRGYAYMPFSGTFDGAETYSQLVLRRATALPENHPVLLSARHRAVLGGARSNAGDESEFRDILARQTAVLGAHHPETLITRHDLAWTVWLHRGVVQSMEEMRQVVGARLVALGPVNPYTLVSRWLLVDMLTNVDAYAEAEVNARETLADCRRELGEDNHDTLMWTAKVTRLLIKRGDLGVASEEFQRLRGGAVLPHSARVEVAGVLRLLGRYDEAEREYQALLDYLLASGLERTTRYQTSLLELGICLHEQGRSDAAVALHAEAVASCLPRPGFDEHHFRLRHDHARAKFKANRLVESEAEFRALLAEATSSPEADQMLVQSVRWNLMLVLQEQDKKVEVERELDILVAAYRGLVGVTEWQTRESLRRHANSLADLSRNAEALAVFRECLTAESLTFGPRHPNVTATRIHINHLELQLGEITPAEALAEIASLPPSNIPDGDTLRSLRLAKNIAAAYHRTGDSTRAIAEYRDTEERCRALGEPARLLRARVLWSLAVLFNDLNRHEEALVTFRTCRDVELELPGQHRADVLTTRSRITRLRLKLAEITASDAVEEFACLVTEYTEQFGAESIRTLRLRRELANTRRVQGDIRTAEAELRDLAVDCRAPDRPNVVVTSHVLWSLATLLMDQERFADALPMLEECLAIEQTIMNDGARAPLRTRRRIIQCRYALGLVEPDVAAAEYQAILPKLVAHDGPEGRLPTTIRAALAELDSART